MRFWRSSLSVFLVVMMVSAPVLAKPSSQPTSLPVGRVIDDLRSYTLEEFKIILKIHADYKSWYTQIPKLKLKVKFLDEIITKKDDQLRLLGSEIETLQTERKRLTEKWKEENRLRHLAENKPKFGTWIAWSVAAVLGVVASALGIILISKD